MDSIDWREPPHGESVMPDYNPQNSQWEAPPMPKGGDQLPDLFLTNLLDDDSLMAGMASDFSGSTGSESEGSPSSFQDFMLGTGIPDNILSIPPEPLPVDSGLPSHSDNTCLFGEQRRIYAPLPFESSTTDPSSLSISKEDLFAPLSNLNADGTTKKRAASEASHTYNSEHLLGAEQCTDPGMFGVVPTPMFPVLEAGSHADARSVVETLRVHTKNAHALPNAAVPEPEPKLQNKGPSRTADSKGEEPVSKKVAHNAIERRYRSNINDRIAGLRDVVPALREMRPMPRGRKRRRKGAAEEEIVDGVSAATKLNKATVLSKATEYILYLKSRETRLLREVNSLHMLIRSMQGGEELLSIWNTEMARIDAQALRNTVQHAPVEVDDCDDIESDDESHASNESSIPQPAFMLSAFLGFSLLGGAAEWGESQRSFAPPTHTRVVGATHQLVKRVSSSDWDVHHLDHVPVHQLILELFRTLALILGVVTLVWSAYRWLSRSRTNMSQVLRDSVLLQRDAESATQEYSRLRRAVGLPGTTVGSVAYLAGSFIRSQATSDTVGARALVRLVEMDISAPRNTRAPWLQRLVNICAAQSAQGPSVKCAAVFALGYEALAEDATLGGQLHDAAMQMWSSARDQLQLADSGSHGPTWLARMLALPLEQAYTYAVQMPCDETQPAASPLNTVVDALRQEELLAFWSALFSSMMRGKDGQILLDVVEDRASVDALRRHLAAAMELTPFRTEATDEQSLVARGTLALVTGRMDLAAACVRMLDTHLATRAGELYAALVRDTDARALVEPQGPLDVLSSTALAWLRVKRDTARGTSSKFAPELQRLVSTTVWMIVGTDDVPAQRSVSSVGIPFLRTCATRPLQGTVQLQAQPLTSSLDTLMDVLGDIL